MAVNAAWVSGAGLLSRALSPVHTGKRAVTRDPQLASRARMSAPKVGEKDLRDSFSVRCRFFGDAPKRGQAPHANLQLPRRQLIGRAREAFIALLKFGESQRLLSRPPRVGDLSPGRSEREDQRNPTYDLHNGCPRAVLNCARSLPAIPASAHLRACRLGMIQTAARATTAIAAMAISAEPLARSMRRPQPGLKGSSQHRVIGERTVASEPTRRGSGVVSARLSSRRSSP